MRSPLPATGRMIFMGIPFYCGVNVEKCLHLCEGRLRQTGSAAPRKMGSFLKVPYNGWGEKLKKLILTLCDKMGMYI